MCSIGAVGVFGPATVAAIVRWSTPTNFANVVYGGTATSGASRWGFGINTAATFNLRCGNSTTNSSAAVATTGEWNMIAVSKATGTATPRFHSYRYSTDGLTQEDGGGTLGNSGTPATSVYLGSPSANFGFNGDYAVAAYWNVVLTDAQVQLLSYDLANWFAAATPKAMWVLDQGATGTKVLDITGGGANESSLAGSSVSTNAVPVWNIGAGPIAVQKSFQKSLMYPSQHSRVLNHLLTR